VPVLSVKLICAEMELRTGAMMMFGYPERTVFSSELQPAATSKTASQHAGTRIGAAP